MHQLMKINLKDDPMEKKMNTSFGSDPERSAANLSRSNSGNFTSPPTKESRSNSYSKSKEIDIKILAKSMAANRKKNVFQS